MSQLLCAVCHWWAPPGAGAYAAPGAAAGPRHWFNTTHTTPHSDPTLLFLLRRLLYPSPPPPHTQVLALTRHQELLQAPDTGATPELDEKIKLRAPYVAPLNILQVRPRLFCAQFVVWCLALKH